MRLITPSVHLRYAMRTKHTTIEVIEGQTTNSASINPSIYLYVSLSHLRHLDNLNPHGALGAAGGYGGHWPRVDGQRLTLRGHVMVLLRDGQQRTRHVIVAALLPSGHGGWLATVDNLQNFPENPLLAHGNPTGPRNTPSPAVLPLQGLPGRTRRG